MSPLVSLSANLLDHFGRHAQPTQAETHDALAEIVAVAIARLPFAVDARPHHAVDELRVGYRIDAVKQLALQATRQRFD